MQCAEAEGLYIEVPKGQNGHCAKQTASQPPVSVSYRIKKKLKKSVNFRGPHGYSLHATTFPNRTPIQGKQVAVPDQKMAMNGARTAGKMHS